MNWDRQINAAGDTLADSAIGTAEAVVDDLGEALRYLDLIAECLVALAWKVEPDAGRRQARLEAIRKGVTP